MDMRTLSDERLKEHLVAVLGVDTILRIADQVRADQAAKLEKDWLQSRRGKSQ